MKKLASIGIALVAACLSANAQFLSPTNTATLSWNAVADANLNSYQLFYWTGISTNVVSVPKSQLNVQIINLNWASTYTVAVKAVAVQGTNTLFSAFSLPVTVITPQAPFLPPAAPTGLTVRGP